MQSLVHTAPLTDLLVSRICKNLYHTILRTKWNADSYLRRFAPYAEHYYWALVVPGLLQPEGDGRLLAFQYPIVSQDEVAPTSKVHPPRLTMISYIPLASRSTSSRSSSFVESSKSFAHSKGLEPLRRQISPSPSFVDRSGGNP